MSLKVLAETEVQGCVHVGVRVLTCVCGHSESTPYVSAL